MINIEALARPEILAMKPYQSARNTAGADGILLNANEVPRSLVQKPGWESLELNRYPIPQPAALNQRLACLYGVRPDQLLITRGSDEGIDLLVRVFCRQGLDAIVECSPCFGMYRIAGAIQGAKLIDIPRDPDKDLRINFDRLCETVGAHKEVRLVFLTTPNNPTGDIIRRADLERVLQACDDHALLVLDEAYIEFCDESSATELLEQWPNLVVLRTLSKAWGAAGLRCGSVIASPLIIGLLGRIMAPYPLTAPAIDAALSVTSEQAAQAQSVLLQELAKGKAGLLDFLAGCKWAENFWPGEANFVLVRVDDARRLVTFCAERGIRIRDFSSQKMLDECVRLTIGSESEMSALHTVLEAYGVKNEPA